MPYLLSDGSYYWTQTELRELLKRKIETYWMLSYCKTEEEKNEIIQSIIFNFRNQYPEFETRTEEDDLRAQAENEAHFAAQREVLRATELKKMEEIEIQKRKDREFRILYLKEIVSRSYQDPDFYRKLCDYIKRCVSEEMIQPTDSNIPHCNPMGFLYYLYERDEIPSVKSSDVVDIHDGGLQELKIGIKDAPVLELFNLENNLENSANAYFYGVILQTPPGSIYQVGSRIILQIKNISRISGMMISSSSSSS